MKKLLIWLVLPILLSAATCSGDDDDSIDLTPSLEQEFEREFTGKSGPDSVYAQTGVTDIKAKSPSFVDIASGLSDVEVISVSYEILDGTTAGTEITDLAIYISDETVTDRSNATLLGEIENKIDVDNLIGKKRNFDMDKFVLGSDKLKELVRNDPHKVKFWAYAKSNQKDVTIKMKVYTKVKATAEL